MIWYRVGAYNALDVHGNIRINLARLPYCTLAISTQYQLIHYRCIPHGFFPRSPAHRNICNPVVIVVVIFCGSRIVFDGWYIQRASRRYPTQMLSKSLPRIQDFLPDTLRPYITLWCPNGGALLILLNLYVVEIYGD